VFLALLPAAATKSDPCMSASAIASSRAWENSSPPQELFEATAPILVA
jgi:hypothetical protein